MTLHPFMTLHPRIKEFHDKVFLDAFLEQQYKDPISPVNLKSTGIFNEISSFLDVACGSGYFAYHLADQYPNMTVRGIDFHARCIEEAKNRGNLSNLRYDELNIYDMDSSYGIFDGVRINNSLHHFDNIDTAVKNIADVMSKGGTLMICDFDRELGLSYTEIEEWYHARKEWGLDYKNMFVRNEIVLGNKPVSRADALLYDSIIAAFTLNEACQSLEISGFTIQESKLVQSQHGVIRYQIFAKNN